jgi:Protein of unknown function (DUF3160)
MTRFLTAMCLIAIGLGACSSATPSDAPEPPMCSGTNCAPPNETPATPGTPVKLELAATDQAALAAFEADLAPLREASAQSLVNAHPVAFDDTLDYDPKTAAGMELIQASPLALNAEELGKLAEQGFAISARTKFPNMAYGLKTIYASDLPVYISIDPILDAVHNSYDAVLKAVEGAILIPDLLQLLNGARQRNSEVTTDAQVRKDLDFYFTVALGLVKGAPVPPLAGGDAQLSDKFVKSALAATGILPIELFGVNREIDFSQFTPRGHYTDSPELTRYFQTMMWLGRIEFRLIETKPGGSRVFHRRQLNAMLAMRDVIQGASAESFQRIDAVVSAFVGEHDYMQLGEIDALLTDLGASSIADVAKIPDQQVAQTILEQGYGAQRILSQVIFKKLSTTLQTLPIDRSFALLGQRYVVDSHVFSEVTYDRVIPRGDDELRILPDPLDAAYAALGNSAALPLLRAGLDRQGYAPQLESMRKLVDAHEPAFWEENLYNLWLSSLRALSPADAAAAAELPSVARTERWSRRVLNTQLASWAQLRHDTILYAKQSYTSGPACEFPDAYVDPYPEAFARLAKFAERGKALAKLFGNNASSELVTWVSDYYTELASVSNILRDMAEQQRKGVPFNAAQMAFVNDAVKSGTAGCGGPTPYTGWYARLMIGANDGAMDPTIADVHTFPGGDRPPQILHVASGLPRLMVLTVDTCNGPRAYAGVSFAYHEVIPDGLKRLNDMEWGGMARDAADVKWMEPVLR